MAIHAGTTSCQTLQTQGRPWQLLKFWRRAQRRAADGICANALTFHTRSTVSGGPVAAKQSPPRRVGCNQANGLTFTAHRDITESQAPAAAIIERIAW